MSFKNQRSSDLRSALPRTTEDRPAKDRSASRTGNAPPWSHPDSWGHRLAAMLSAATENIVTDFSAGAGIVFPQSLLPTPEQPLGGNPAEQKRQPAPSSGRYELFLLAVGAAALAIVGYASAAELHTGCAGAIDPLPQEPFDAPREAAALRP